MAYLNVTEVESAIEGLATAFPSLCQRVPLPNTTHEGRTCHALRIGTGAIDDRPAMLFIGGQHAREWGSCEICINVAADLLEAYTAGTGISYGGQAFSAADVRQIVERSQVFLFPGVNPDGRNHSQTVSPMWRKNRNPGGAVDVNRNYDFLWDFRTTFSASSPIVVSDDPTSDIYHGTAPFSEPETRNVRWLLDTYPQIRWFIDVHSFGRLLYHNWGDDQNQIVDPSMNFLNPAFNGARGVRDDAAYREYIRPGDVSASRCLVEGMRDAVQAVRGQTYSTGQAFDLYPTSGTATDYPYSRHWVDPSKTKTLGFLIEWGAEFQPPWAEMENIILDVSAALVRFARSAPCTCSIIEVELLTPALLFNDVPAGETTFRAVRFSVTSCRDVHFEIVAGPTALSGPPGTAFGTPLGTSSATSGPSNAEDVRLWISWTAGTAGDMVTGEVRIRCVETGEEWTIPISGDCISRPSALAGLVFDQSNSMNFDSGIAPGVTRGDVLRFSAPPFLHVAESVHSVAMVGFDHDARDLLGVTQLDLAGKLAADVPIRDYSPNPNGWTSIGEGLARAHEVVSSASGSFGVRAIVVLTDGEENHNGYTRRYISDVSGMIGERVFAIGLGTPENLRPAALQALCNGTQGYLLVTGALDTSSTFRLAKYYQQILAGVTNHDIILDPEGSIAPGQRHSIPFSINEADIDADVVVLTPAPDAIRLALQAPNGTIIRPTGPTSSPAVKFQTGKNVVVCRISLPAPTASGAAHAGVWRAILEVDDKYWQRYLESVKRAGQTHGAGANGIPYSLTARTYSNLRMNARVHQTGLEPGATFTVRAVLTEYGVPVEDRASVRAELERPDGTHTVLLLGEVEPGVFEASLVASMSGVYRFRIMAKGTTFRGARFTREQIATGAVWQGGNTPPPNGRDNPGHGKDCVCKLLKCLLDTKGVREQLGRLGIDAAGFAACLKHWCECERKMRGDGAEKASEENGGPAFLDPAVRTAIVELIRRHVGELRDA